MMNNERYMKLLTKISNNGLDDNCTVEIMAWHNQTGQPVKNLCGLPEKIVLQRLIEEYLLKKEENAELRARLEKSVELKAKVGDTIYLPWIYDGTYDVASLLITGIYFKNDEFHYITNLESDSAIYLAKYEYGIFRNQDFDNIVFTARIAAESRLAKMKGEKE